MFVGSWAKEKKEISICVEFAKMCADSVAYLNDKPFKNIISEVNTANTANTTKAAEYAIDAAIAVVSYKNQKETNRDFLIQCIKNYENKDN